MKTKLLATLVGGAALALPSMASAVTLQIDDFSEGVQNLVVFSSTSTAAPEVGPFASILGGYRELSAVFTKGAGAPGGLPAAVVVDAGGTNTLGISTPPEWTVVTTLTWDGPGTGSFAATDFTAFGDAIAVDVIFADLNGSTIEFDLTDSSNNTSTLTKVINSPGLFSFSFVDFAGAADLTQISKVVMVINGVNSFDGQFDIVGITNSVPEPMTAGLGLLSMGALGAFATRRRQA